MLSNRETDKTDSQYQRREEVRKRLSQKMWEYGVKTAANRTAVE